MPSESSKRKASTPSPTATPEAPAKKHNADTTRRTMNELKELINGLSDKIGSMEKNLSDRLDRLERSFEEDKTQILAKQQELEARIDSLERQNKRQNIVVTGLPIKKDSSALQTLNLFLKEKINKDVSALDAFAVRLKSGDYKIIAKMGSVEDKMKIMKEKREAKGLDSVFINDDLIKKDQFAQYKARELKKTMTEKGKNVKIGFRKVFIDGREHAWDEQSLTYKERKN